MVGRVLQDSDVDKNSRPNTLPPAAILGVMELSKTIWTILHISTKDIRVASAETEKVGI